MIAIHLLESVYNDFDVFPIPYIYIFVLIGQGHTLTFLLANEFRALISQLDSHTCTVKPYWFICELI